MEKDMIEFRVEWCQCPTAHNSPRVFYVKTANKEDADKIGRDHIERKYGCSWFLIQNISESKPVPAGAIVER